jgi:hypothetical protein
VPTSPSSAAAALAAAAAPSKPHPGAHAHLHLPWRNSWVPLRAVAAGVCVWAPRSLASGSCGGQVEAVFTWCAWGCLWPIRSPWRPWVHTRQHTS